MRPGIQRIPLPRTLSSRYYFYDVALVFVAACLLSSVVVAVVVFVLVVSFDAVIISLFSKAHTEPHAHSHAWIAPTGTAIPSGDRVCAPRATRALPAASNVPVADGGPIACTNAGIAVTDSVVITPPAIACVEPAGRATAACNNADKVNWCAYL